MKRGFLANKFWALLSVVIFVLLTSVYPYPCCVTLMATADTATAESETTETTDTAGDTDTVDPDDAEKAATVTAPTYYFNRTPENNGSILSDLGIIAYNEYLYELSRHQALPEVVIAVIDSGLNANHQVFTDRILTEYAMNFNHEDDLTANDWNFDISGHGTHVAGLIADSTMSNVKILPIKIFQGLPNETIAGSIIEDAINYLCQLKTQQNLNIVAVNMSLGTSAKEYDPSYYLNFQYYQTYVNKLRTAGILPIVAAGNDGSGKYYSLPSACTGAVAVSSYNHRDENRLSSFSNYGQHIALSAPGEYIVSASNDKDSWNSVQVLSGTSMATPYVTISYALLMSDASKTTAAALGVTWNNSEMKNPYYYLNPQHKALLLAATDLGPKGLDVAYGYGAVNVASLATAPAAVPFKASKAKEEMMVSTETESLLSPTEESDWTTAVWIIAGLGGLVILIYGLRSTRQMDGGIDE